MLYLLASHKPAHRIISILRELYPLQRQCNSLAPIQISRQRAFHIYCCIYWRHNVAAILINDAYANLFRAHLCCTEPQANHGEEQWVRRGNLSCINCIEANADGHHLAATLVSVITQESEIHFQACPLRCNGPGLAFFHRTDQPLIRRPHTKLKRIFFRQCWL